MAFTRRRRLILRSAAPQLFSLLDDADLGAPAADAFLLLMSDSPDVLNRGCHADVRLMYRQRFFSENSAKLVQGFNAAPQGGADRPAGPKQKESVFVFVNKVFIPPEQRRNPTT